MTKRKKKNTKKNSIQLKSSLQALLAFIIVLMLLPLISYISNSSGDTNYISDIGDLPLPVSFKQKNDETVVYDTPEGRIIETEAIGRGDKQAILIFFAESLPPLGWKTVQHHGGNISARYIKDDEKLDISISENADESILINFYLAPYRKSPLQL